MARMRTLALPYNLWFWGLIVTKLGKCLCKETYGARLWELRRHLSWLWQK